ncbi:MAG: GlgB N-terminal domain-containing protein, partial [Achromobacter piechaudii]
MNRTDNGGMPPSSTPAGQVDAATLHALAGGQHADPFAVLGPHDGVVRALLPGALAVAVVSPDGTRAPLHEQAQGLFTGAAPEARPGDPGSYQLAIQWPGSEQLTPDPYAFGPVLSDADLAGLASGDWRAALDLLGARLVEMNGVSGLRCAVWAPNARRVGVVGDFNSWDSRRHPMRLRHAAGVWELFIPGVCAGDCYKFAITDTTGAIVFKADPMARRAQAAPATASVVDDPTPHVWTDEDWMRARGERQQPRAPISI